MAYPIKVAMGSIKASEVYSPTSTGQDFLRATSPVYCALYLQAEGGQRRRSDNAIGVQSFGCLESFHQRFGEGTVSSIGSVFEAGGIQGTLHAPHVSPTEVRRCQV